jgi:ABC-2 type transport system ATP-binding protein
MIEVRGLSKTYKDHGALREFSLSVPERSAFALVGPNGAGKTTLIKVLMNLISPTSGTAQILGVDSRRISRKELSQIGYVSENQEMPTGLTVSQYLRYLRAFYPQWDVSLEDEILKQFELPEDRKIGDLSHGMRVKFALACALPYRPKLLVLDEPFSGLDPLVRDEFMENLAARAEEMTILISSHDLAEVEGFATHVAFVDQGKLLFQEPMETLTGRVQQIKVTVERQTVMRLPVPESWIDVHEFGNVLTFVDTQFSGVDLDEQIRSRLDGVRHVDIQSMPLRSIFTSLAKATRKPVSKRTD